MAQGPDVVRTVTANTSQDDVNVKTPELVSNARKLQKRFKSRNNLHHAISFEQRMYND